MFKGKKAESKKWHQVFLYSCYLLLLQPPSFYTVNQKDLHKRHNAKKLWNRGPKVLFLLFSTCSETLLYVTKPHIVSAFFRGGENGCCTSWLYISALCGYYMAHIFVYFEEIQLFIQIHCVVSWNGSNFINLEDTKCWQGWGRGSRTSHTLLKGGWTCLTTLENMWKFLKPLTRPTIWLRQLAHREVELYIQNKDYAEMFIVALFAIAWNYKQFNCPQVILYSYNGVLLSNSKKCWQKHR